MSIRSMTGYGQASVDVGQARISVELRSLNHRYADLRLRLPVELSADEREIRRTVLARVRRGRVELTVNLEPLEGNASRPQLNAALVEEAIAAQKTLREQYDIDGKLELDSILGLQGLFRSTAVELAWTDEAREALGHALSSALDALERDRAREGAHLQQDLQARLRTMIEIAGRIHALAVEVPARIRRRLVERLDALAADVELDPARVAQEAVLLADRADVTEELVRLEGHLQQAASLLDPDDGRPVGKRLDFLLQEINRETNTINSKSADLEMSREALALKAELERVREQVQNVE